MRQLFSILLIFIFIQSCKAPADKKPPADNGTANSAALVGSWKCVADQELNNENAVIKQDTSVSGLLIYTADGKMSVQICWRNTRSAIMSDSIMDQDGKSFGLGIGSNTWSLEQSRKIIDTYDAYFGDYTVDWNKKVVTHIVKGNLRPEAPGITYQRIFQIKDDSLFLRSTDRVMKWQTAFVRNK